jgi:hypothetical protein
VTTAVGVKKTDTVSNAQCILINLTTAGILKVNSVKSITMSGEGILSNKTLDILDVAMWGYVTTESNTVSVKRILMNTTTAVLNAVLLRKLVIVFDCVKRRRGSA